jgi:hypothetical protein
MKKIAVQKAKELRAPTRRWLEDILGGPVKEADEVTILVSPAGEGTVNGIGPSCYELAQRARLIGIVKDAPPDLSTEKRHLHGFGGK